MILQFISGILKIIGKNGLTKKPTILLGMAHVKEKSLFVAWNLIGATLNILDKP